MALNPFRETEDRIAAGGLGAGLVRNADPRTDPNGNVHRLYPAEGESGHTARAGDAPGQRQLGERLGRWATLSLLTVTAALAVVLVAFSLAGGLPAPRPTEPSAPEPSPAALSDPPPTVAEPAPAPAAASAAPPPARAAPVAAPPPQPVDSAALLSRGAALIEAGEVAAARPLLERAALAGSAAAALRLGRSYDPGSGAIRRPEPDANLGLAIFWYRRGQELGDPTAAFLARQLETAARAGWPTDGGQRPRRHPR